MAASYRKESSYINVMLFQASLSKQSEAFLYASLDNGKTGEIRRRKTTGPKHPRNGAGQPDAEGESINRKHDIF
jgi:hypothetical protein